MNLAQLMSFVITVTIFTGASMAITYEIDMHNCSKLTEKNYIISKYYNMTKIPYEDGLKACNNFQDFLAYTALALLPTGAILGGFNFWRYRTKKDKGIKQ